MRVLRFSITSWRGRTLPAFPSANPRLTAATRSEVVCCSSSKRDRSSFSTSKLISSCSCCERCSKSDCNSGERVIVNDFPFEKQTIPQETDPQKLNLRRKYSVQFYDSLPPCPSACKSATGLLSLCRRSGQNYKFKSCIALIRCVNDGCVWIASSLGFK